MFYLRPVQMKCVIDERPGDVCDRSATLGTWMRRSHLYMATLSSLAAAAPACDSDNGGITLPAGFCALVVADGLGAARHAVVAPNGDVYVALQGGRSRGAASWRCAMPRRRPLRRERKIRRRAASPASRFHNGYLYVATSQRWSATR